MSTGFNVDSHDGSIKYPMPLWAAVDQYHEALTNKIGAFLAWLQAVESAAPESLEASVNIIYESPFTPGGPFARVPKAVISGSVLYRGFAARTQSSGKEPERRAMTLGLQSMQVTPDPAVAVKRIIHNLTWYSKPESDLLPS